MSTIEERRRIATAGVREAPMNGVATRVFLQPIAAPSILGLAGFAGATFIVASNLAGWWALRNRRWRSRLSRRCSAESPSSWRACGRIERVTRSQRSPTGHGDRSGWPT